MVKFPSAGRDVLAAWLDRDSTIGSISFWVLVPEFEPRDFCPPPLPRTGANGKKKKRRTWMGLNVDRLAPGGYQLTAA